MSDLDKIRLQLEQMLPEDKSLALIEIRNLITPICYKRGLNCKIGYCLENELTPNLISRIENSCNDFSKKIKERINKDKSCRHRYQEGTCRKIYFEVIYAILIKHNFGEAGNNGKLKKISKASFAERFGIDRGTLSSNEDQVDFYNEKKMTYPMLKPIFFEIEDMLINET